MSASSTTVVRGAGAPRSHAQMREQYVLEKELATKLMRSAPDERAYLYSSVYEELFRRIPHHPQLTKKSSREERARLVARQIRSMQAWLTPNAVFLEVGAGDCALSMTIAAQVARVYAVDVSDTITSSTARPANFTLVLSDGTSIPVPQGEITVAYSNQLMEHLHPDDALQQLRNIHAALAPGGSYICITPNRLTGPHDISGYFADPIATGLHLREYTTMELIGIFRSAGFRTVKQLIRMPGGYRPIPNAISAAVEHAVASIPRQLRSRIVKNRIVRALLQVRLVAVK